MGVSKKDMILSHLHAHSHIHTLTHTHPFNKSKFLFSTKVGFPQLFGVFAYLKSIDMLRFQVDESNSGSDKNSGWINRPGIDVLRGCCLLEVIIRSSFMGIECKRLTI